MAPTLLGHLVSHLSQFYCVGSGDNSLSTTSDLLSYSFLSAENFRKMSAARRLTSTFHSHVTVR